MPVSFKKIAEAAAKNNSPSVYFVSVKRLSHRGSESSL